MLNFLNNVDPTIEFKQIKHYSGANFSQFKLGDFSRINIITGKNIDNIECKTLNTVDNNVQLTRKLNYLTTNPVFKGLKLQVIDINSKQILIKEPFTDN